VSGTAAGIQAEPRIWFAPMDPFFRPAIHGGGSADFMQLFQPGSAWPRAASYVHVFKLYPQFLRKASDTDLRTVIEGLAQRRIALAIEIGLLRPSDACGRGIEGHDNDQLEIALRIKKLGGSVQYVAADEPVWFGHGFDGPKGCRAAIKALAKNAAMTAREFRSVFPAAKFVDIEPISNFKNADWIEEVEKFHSAFQEDYGEPFSALHIDIDWQQAWQSRASAITAYSRRIGQSLGVIYNGDPNDEPSEAWLAKARQHYTAYEALVGGSPHDAIFQSWVPRPTAVLPETSPGAFTNIILKYVNSHPRIMRRE
jgi:hypothetical protein